MFLRFDLFLILPVIASVAGHPEPVTRRDASEWSAQLKPLKGWPAFAVGPGPVPWSYHALVPEQILARSADTGIL